MPEKKENGELAEEKLKFVLEETTPPETNDVGEAFRIAKPYEDYEPNEYKIAGEIFGQYFQGSILFNHSEPKFLLYNVEKFYWGPDNKKELITQVAEYLNEKYKEVKDDYNEVRQLLNSAGGSVEPEEKTRILKSIGDAKKYINGLRNKQKIQNICALGESLVPTTNEDLNNHTDKLTVKNGAIDLTTGILITDPDKCKKLMDTNQANVVFDPDAKAPIFEKVLWQASCEDKEWIEYMQIYLGSMLTGETHDQKIHIAHGPGRNSKGSIMDTIIAIAGTYAATIPTSLLLSHKHSSGAHSATPELAKLSGKRIAVASEGSEGATLNMTSIKTLTGENKLPVRALYKNPFMLTPRFKVYVETNFLFQCPETDFGSWRRIVVIPFNRIIEDHEVDKDLRIKLLKEKSGILNWLIEGSIKYYKSGLPKCKAIEEATENYRENSDTFGRFIKECLVSHPHKTLKAAILLNRYNSWAEDNGLPLVNKRNFGEELKRRKLKKGRNSEGNYYCNIAVRSNYNDDPNPNYIDLAA